MLGNARRVLAQCLDSHQRVTRTTVVNERKQKASILFNFSPDPTARPLSAMNSAPCRFRGVFLFGKKGRDTMIDNLGDNYHIWEPGGGVLMRLMI